MQPAYVLSFDVEEHHRIEAAYGLEVPAAMRSEYSDRMERTMRVLLELLARMDVKATFYIVGEIAETHPKLVRDIATAGHEVGSHSWDHRRVNRFTPEEFREDLLRSKEALEDAAGVPVFGFRAPTFSVDRQTGWAIDVLAECGFRYDSSVFPIRHDRYGVPDAPRSPFIALGQSAEVLELPPATWRVSGQNLPVAGGGYFRLFPSAIMRRGLTQLPKQISPAVGMLYFHPWEFDPGQPKLALGRASRLRTYVGIGKSEARLGRLLARYRGRFRRAIEVAEDVGEELPSFSMGVTR